MAKYSYKFKQKVVKEYLTGEGGYKCLAERNAISNKCILQNWVKAHREFEVIFALRFSGFFIVFLFVFIS